MALSVDERRCSDDDGIQERTRRIMKGALGALVRLVVFAAAVSVVAAIEAASAGAATVKQGG